METRQNFLQLIEKYRESRERYELVNLNVLQEDVPKLFCDHSDFIFGPDCAQRAQNEVDSGEELSQIINLTFDIVDQNSTILWSLAVMSANLSH